VLHLSLFCQNENVIVEIYTNLDMLWPSKNPTKLDLDELTDLNQWKKQSLTYLWLCTLSTSEKLPKSVGVYKTSCHWEILKLSFLWKLGRGLLVTYILFPLNTITEEKVWRKNGNLYTKNNVYTKNKNNRRLVFFSWVKNLCQFFQVVL